VVVVQVAQGAQGAQEAQEAQEAQGAQEAQEALELQAAVARVVPEATCKDQGRRAVQPRPKEATLILQPSTTETRASMAWDQ